MAAAAIPAAVIPVAVPGAPEVAEDPAAALNAALDGIGAVVVSDYGKGALRDVTDLIDGGRRGGIPVLVDPKRKDLGAYGGATVLTPNLRELEAARGVADAAHVLSAGQRRGSPSPRFRRSGAPRCESPPPPREPAGSRSA